MSNRCNKSWPCVRLPSIFFPFPYWDIGNVSLLLGQFYSSAVHEFRDHCSVSRTERFINFSVPIHYISHDNANISDRDEGCVVLECRDDGSFFPMYCKGETCWCTDVTKGNEIENTRGPKGSFHCTEQGVKVCHIN